MIKYVFKLEAVLKVRKMAEERARQDLGRLQMKKSLLQSDIKTQYIDIDQLYTNQDQHLKDTVRPSILLFYSKSIEAKKSVIEQLKKKEKEMDQQIKVQMDFLIQKKAELKMIENIKDKDVAQYKKKFERDQNIKIEEQVQIWKENLNRQQES
jgi:flagellar FliJ protein